MVEQVNFLGGAIMQAQKVHPDFLGSWFIKAVLPVMYPELSYEGLMTDSGGAGAGQDLGGYSVRRLTGERMFTIMISSDNYSHFYY
jgi:hypothetical protein